MLEFKNIAKDLMTLPSEGRKLDQNEISSIENAVKEAGIQQIHPEKMEAFAESMVSKLKGSGKYWNSDSALSE
tara:strand:- start:190 stop:408 length:219 start_codon:yes stop_codon:yes gene_type:complete